MLVRTFITHRVGRSPSQGFQQIPELLVRRCASGHSPNTLSDQMTPPTPVAQLSSRGCHPYHPKDQKKSSEHLARRAALIGEQSRITTSITPADTWKRMPTHNADPMGNTSCPLSILMRVQDDISCRLLLPAALALPVSSSTGYALPVSYFPFSAETERSRVAQPKVATRRLPAGQQGLLPSSQDLSREQEGYRACHSGSSHSGRKSAHREPGVAVSKGSLEHLLAGGEKQALGSTKSKGGKLSLRDRKEASSMLSASRTNSHKGKSPRSRRRSLCRAALAWLGIRMATENASAPKSAPIQGFSGNGGSSANKKRSGGRDQDDGDDRGSSKKHRAKKTKSSADEKESKRLWACPFLRKDQCVHHRCGTFIMQKISHVFQHLLRIHFAEGDLVCARCGLELETQQDYDEHIRAGSCPSLALSGMTKRQQMAIQEIARRRGGGLSDEDKWYACWDVLFPSTPRPVAPRGPYLEHPFLEECSRMWQVFGGVEHDSAVLAEYQAGDGEAGLQRLLEIIRGAMVRRISEFLHVRPRPRHSPVPPRAQEHGPILQPRPPPVMAPPTRHLRRLQNRPAHSSSAQGRSSHLSQIRGQPARPHSLDTRTRPGNMPAHVQREEAGVGQNPVLEFEQFSEALLPRGPEEGQLWNTTRAEGQYMAYSSPPLWMNPTIPDDNFMSAQDFGSDAHGSEPVSFWGNPFSLLSAQQTMSPQRAPEAHGVLSSTPDVDEYVAWENAGENNFMPDGRSRRLGGYGRPR